MPTFRRLLSFLGPYRRQNIGSIVLASLAMGMTVLIPWLVGRAVNAVNDGDTDGLVPLVIAAVKATEAALGPGLGAARDALGVLVSFDVIFVTNDHRKLSKGAPAGIVTLTWKRSSGSASAGSVQGGETMQVRSTSAPVTAALGNPADCR